MQFAKLFKVKFAVVLVKGYQTRPCETESSIYHSKVHVCYTCCQSHHHHHLHNHQRYKERCAQTQKKLLKKQIKSNDYLNTMYKVLF